MLTLTQAVDTFPSVRIPSDGGGLPRRLEASPDAGFGEHYFAGAGKMIRIGADPIEGDQCD